MCVVYKCNLRLVPACLHCASTRNRGTVAVSRPLSASCKSSSPVGMSQAITRIGFRSSIYVHVQVKTNKVKKPVAEYYLDTPWMISPSWS